MWETNMSGDELIAVAAEHFDRHIELKGKVGAGCHT